MKATCFLGLMSAIDGHIFNKCASICRRVKACRDDVHHGDSYCKDWQDPPVCFGLYETRGRNGEESGGKTADPSQEAKLPEELLEDELLEDLALFEAEAADGRAESVVAEYCYHPTDADCDHLKLEPVDCSSFIEDTEANAYCERLCASTASCVQPESSRGSYCTTWRDKPVCYGLFVKTPAVTPVAALKIDETRFFRSYCYQPGDPDCNDRELSPVTC